MLARLFTPFLILLIISCDNLVTKDEESLVLGNQIDRAGRASINLILNKTFKDDTSRSQSQNSYNKTDNDNSSSYINEVAQNLAIYDAFFDEGADGNSCGDNPLTNRASLNPGASLATGADRYDALATVFVDDQIYINASTSMGSELGECSQYFAVELTALGVTGFENDCGGLLPTYDVVETNYSLVFTGVRSGVDDGVSADDVSHSNTNFPFLGAPK